MNTKIFEENDLEKLFILINDFRCFYKMVIVDKIIPYHLSTGTLYVATLLYED